MLILNINITTTLLPSYFSQKYNKLKKIYQISFINSNPLSISLTFNNKINMNSKKNRIKSAGRSLLSVYVSCPSHMPEIRSRRQPAKSGPKRSLKQLKPQQEHQYDIFSKNQLSSHTYVMKNQLNNTRFQQIQTFKSEMARTKRNHLEKRIPYIKSSLSPYLAGSDPMFIKQMMERNKPVTGPTDSIKQSIYKYKQSNLDNVEVVLNNRKIEGFSDKMEEFAVRSGFPSNSKFFISNSKDCFIKQQLLSLGWLQNKSRQSKYFHFKWVVNDLPSDYAGLQYQQRFNHFNNNKQLTNKNSLQKNIRKYNRNNQRQKILIPLSFDIQNQKEKDLFQEQYQKQMVLSILKQFIRAVKEKRSKHFQELMRKKQLWTSAFKIGKSVQSDKLMITTADLYQKQKDTGFMFEIKLLSLVLSYFYNVMEMESNYILPFSRQMWSNNSFSLSRLSNSIDYFQISSILQTPSQLFINEMFKIYINLSQNKDFYSYGQNNIWMAKSVGISRGNGITIIKQKQKLLETANVQKKLIQKYIENPLIFCNITNQSLKFVEDKKFDLRQWVLVKSLSPLEVYKFDRCYVRLCSQKYSKYTKDYSNLKQHLTNYSQNKTNFEKREESVISLEQLKLLLPPNVYQTKISPKIDKIIYRTLLACSNNMTHSPSSFQLYGFDILISQNYETWLLEVNLSPACQERTKWMGVYLKQMTQGLISLVVDSKYYDNEESKFQNHWKQIEYQYQNRYDQEGFEIEREHNKRYQENVSSIVTIQRFWRMIEKRKKMREYFNVDQ